MLQWRQNSRAGWSLAGTEPEEWCLEPQFCMVEIQEVREVPLNSNYVMHTLNVLMLLVYACTQVWRQMVAWRADWPYKTEEAAHPGLMLCLLHHAEHTVSVISLPHTNCREREHARDHLCQ